jgi:ribonuclease HI
MVNIMIECWIDGACEPNNPGGIMSAGFIIKENSNVLHRHGQVIKPKEESRPEDSTNNVAEYAALWLCIKWLKVSKFEDKEIKICGDSQLVINQMWGSWGIKKGAYVSLAHKCREELSHFSRITGEWVPRENNEEADYMSKIALVKAGIKVKNR